MNIVYTATALDEITEILEYVVKDNTTAAHQLSEAIEKTVALIAYQPGIARVIFRSGVRAFPVHGYKYRIFYTAKAKDVIIRNVRSMRRQFPKNTQ